VVPPPARHIVLDRRENILCAASRAPPVNGYAYVLPAHLLWLRYYASFARHTILPVEDLTPLLRRPPLWCLRSLLGTVAVANLRAAWDAPGAVASNSHVPTYPSASPPYAGRLRRVA